MPSSTSNSNPIEEHGLPPDSAPAQAARYRAFVDQDAAGIAEIDASGRFKRVNRQFCTITGYSEAELATLRFQDITHPDDLSAFEEQVRCLLQQGGPFAVEKRFVRKDRSEVWVYLSVTKIQAEPGERPSVLAVVIDVSQRRRAEAAARSSEESYRSLFNSIDAGFCVIEIIFDREGQPIDYEFLEMNAVFQTVTGLANAQSRRMRDLVPTHEQHWFDIYGQIARTGEPKHFEQEARALNRWYSVYAFRIGEVGSNKVGVLFEDITTRRQSEQRRLFLADLSEKLASLRNDTDVIRTAVHALGRFMQVDRCLGRREGISSSDHGRGREDGSTHSGCAGF